MYYIPYPYPYTNPYYRFIPTTPYVPHYAQAQMRYNRHADNRYSTTNRITDQGAQPFVINIEEVTENNKTFRTALWTGDYLQVTLMSIPIGEDIGLEVHEDHDQFLRIEDGNGVVEMGPNKNELTFRRAISEDIAIMVPAGTWHNVTNVGNEPLQLYSIYSPPEYPLGTVHPTKADAMEEE